MSNSSTGSQNEDLHSLPLPQSIHGFIERSRPDHRLNDELFGRKLSIVLLQIFSPFGMRQFRFAKKLKQNALKLLNNIIGLPAGNNIHAIMVVSYVCHRKNFA